MKFNRRVLGLTGAGVAALVLGGSAGVLHHGGDAFAGAPTNAAIGCATTSARITFATGAGGLIVGSETVQVDGSTNAQGNGFLSELAPTATITCGAVFQDSGSAGGFPASVPGTTTHGVATGDTDGNPNTIDGGVITYTVSGPVVISETHSAVDSVNCGVAAPADVSTTTTTPLPPPLIVTHTAVTNESCQGAVPTTTLPGAATPAVTPNPGNTLQVQIAPNTSFGAIGGVGLSGATIAASYTRFSAIAPTAPATFSAGTAPITFVQPYYAIVLNVSNGTINAALPSAASAQSANGTSTITANLFRSTTQPCQSVSGVAGFICGNGLFGGPVGLVGSPIAGPLTTFYFAPGAEPGALTFATNNGLWVGTSQSGSALNTNTSAQTVSVQCGSQPGTNPVITQPLLGQAFSLGLTSCVSVSATLAGGGSAGTAQIVVSYIGDFTGTNAQQTTQLNLVPGPSTTSLTTGCNEAVTPANLAPGSSSATVAQLVSGFNVASIWMFSNATHTFAGLFFSAAGAPTDVGSAGPSQSLFICGTGTGTFQVSS